MSSSSPSASSGGGPPKARPIGSRREARPARAGDDEGGGDGAPKAEDNPFLAQVRRVRLRSSRTSEAEEANKALRSAEEEVRRNLASARKLRDEEEEEARRSAEEAAGRERESAAKGKTEGEASTTGRGRRRGPLEARAHAFVDEALSDDAARRLEEFKKKFADARRKELVAIMRQKGSTKEERARRMEEVKRRYAAMAAAALRGDRASGETPDAGAAPRGVEEGKGEAGDADDGPGAAGPAAEGPADDDGAGPVADEEGATAARTAPGAAPETLPAPPATGPGSRDEAACVAGALARDRTPPERKERLRARASPKRREENDGGPPPPSSSTTRGHLAGTVREMQPRDDVSEEGSARSSEEGASQPSTEGLSSEESLTDVSLDDGAERRPFVDVEAALPIGGPRVPGRGSPPLEASKSISRRGRRKTSADGEGRPSAEAGRGRRDPKTRSRNRRRRLVVAVAFVVGAAAAAAAVYLTGGFVGGGGGEGTAPATAADPNPPATSTSSADRGEDATPDPPAAARADAAPFPHPKPAFRYRPFDELDLASRNVAVQDLGYAPTTWNTHGLAPVEDKSWGELGAVERHGAALLGFDADVWDCFVDHYSSYAWEDLPAAVAGAYRGLGWTRAHWEGRVDALPDTESKWWDLLAAEEKGAARALCYFEDNWDGIDMNPNPGYFPHPVPVARYVPWDELGAVARQVATSMMGYSGETWNNYGSADVESNTLLDLAPDARAGAMELGFYTHTWDCFVNHYLSYHWSSFHGDLKLAVEALGWDEALWKAHDADDAPASERTLWADLTAQERAAATRLCYFEELWDGTHISWWYDYDARENTAVASDDPPPDDIDLHIFDETGYAGKEVGSVGRQH